MYLTVHQASKYCSVSPKTICNWIDDGHIKAFGRSGDIVGSGRRIWTPFSGAGHPGLRRSGQGDRKKILVIDDDRLIVETIVSSLEEEPHDYEIISAADGFEAGLQVSHFRPDVLILDIMMPDVDGYEVCKRVKQDLCFLRDQDHRPLSVLG